MNKSKVVEIIDHKARTDIGEHIAECNQNRKMIESWFGEMKSSYEKLVRKIDANYTKLDGKMDVNQKASNSRFDKINNKLWAALVGLVGLLIAIIFFLLEK